MAARDALLRAEIERMTSSGGHRELVDGVLRELRSSKDLVRFIHRYTVFNGNFAGGVANLAGAFHVRQDLFRDAHEAIGACADRSARIASYIFFAAEDEYSDRDDRSRITHRDLGQSVLKGSVEFLGLDTPDFDERFPLNETTQAALEAEPDALRWGLLPETYWVPYDGGRHWRPGDPLRPPPGLVLHHANWTIGVAHKLAQLREAERALAAGARTGPGPSA
ncbi:MAG: hypothetical protein JRH10_05280 [Deltaproteobacteria bacterium]|nr:hypothetical protein [Deltaproteobacteria bacterium]MBW2444472.1 hypothetical protein [Deltaproteobacteria bacterium]